MATINSDPKTAYVYDEATSSWYSIGGSTNTVANYTWSGTQNWQNVVTFEDAINTLKKSKLEYLYVPSKGLLLKKKNA